MLFPFGDDSLKLLHLIPSDPDESFLIKSEPPRDEPLVRVFVYQLAGSTLVGIGGATGKMRSLRISADIFFG